MSKNRGVRKNQRARVFAKTNHLCWYCGEYEDTGDHFLPILLTRERKRMLPYEAKNRRNILNIIPACMACNQAKRGMLLEEFRQYSVPTPQGELNSSSRY